MNSHSPVLPAEIINFLAPENGEFFIDGTLGLGGHSRILLEKISPGGRLLGLDADPRNLALARENLSDFPNVEFRNSNFRDVEKIVPPNSVDGILLDLGVSSPHFDDAERGVSFRKNGPLDAAEILNHFPENEIADILRNFGEIGISKKLARQIVESRRKKKFARTFDLVEIVAAKKLLPQIFQSLRIAVNDELGALDAILNSAPKILKSGGRIAVISFHSLEDRIVKNFFREQKKAGVLEILTKKPIVPKLEEIEKNPRARSAKLRVAKKLNQKSEI